MAWEMHYPDEINPTISFSNERGPSIVEAPTVRERDPSAITDEMGDAETVRVDRHGRRSRVEYVLSFIPLTSEKLAELDAFADFAGGRPFRMRDTASQTFATFKSPDAFRYTATFKRTAEGDGWDLAIRVRQVA